MNTNSLKKAALVLGGHGRHMQTSMSRTTKRKLDRQPDKRRRRQQKEECRKDT